MGLRTHRSQKPLPKEASGSPQLCSTQSWTLTLVLRTLRGPGSQALLGTRKPLRQQAISVYYASEEQRAVPRLGGQGGAWAKGVRGNLVLREMLP